MNRTVFVCGKCGRTVENKEQWTRGWLIASHLDAEKQFQGEMVIRCPQHITRHALRIAAGGKSAIR